MRDFSIIPNSSQSAIEQYSDFLSREVYSNMQPYDVNDPLFLQQLGVLQGYILKGYSVKRQTEN
ncbi:MAG: hypothetical protein LBM67_03255 [Lentimicrobiaceae bacterium]|jgi:hypothetical protein|nr:hypothetical protein [Lentimicrobiaceae bacterium]